MNEYYPDENAEAEEGVEYYAIRPNKTQIKKQIADVFAMAEEISQFSPAQMQELPLAEDIRNSLAEAGKMPANSARKRLLKYVTQQLRSQDVDSVREKLARMKNQSAHATREHHQSERWRDALLSGEPAALTHFLADFPHADGQHIRQLLRNAQKEAQTGKPPKSARQLYRYIKQTLGGENEADDFTGDAEPDAD